MFFFRGYDEHELECPSNFPEPGVTFSNDLKLHLTNKQSSKCVCHEKERKAAQVKQRRPGGGVRRHDAFMFN